MRKTRFIILLLSAFTFTTISSCNDDSDPESTNTNTDTTVDVEEDGGYTATITEALEANSNTHQADADYTWNESDIVTITLNGSSITVEPAVANVDGGTVTITTAGTYSISGTLDNGQVIVDTEDEATVRLILNGASINNSSTSPLYIANAEKAVIVLAENTTNSITDGATYVFESEDEDEPNAALFSKADLTIYGKGSLTVNGNYNDGIVSKDGLIIGSGSIRVTAADDGIRGKDYLIVEDGAIQINAGGDGLKSDNDEDTDAGYIWIEGGDITITSAGDAIAAETDALVGNGKFTLTAGGGSSSSIADDDSAKGIKAGVLLIIEGGTLAIDAADDGVHSNANISLNGGAVNIATGDDAVHADAYLGINGSDLTISKSYEGIEASVIAITDGTIHVTSSDDGINGATDDTSIEPYLYVYGGYIYVDAAGDGIDINGSIVMTDGTVIVNGPTTNSNAAIDYDNSFKISGGFLLAAGSSGMAQIPGTSSSQNSVLVTLSSAQAAGSLVHLQASDGTTLATFKPAKKYQSFAFSSPDLKTGTTYSLYLGGSSSGTATDGLYSGGTYTTGTLSTSFTISSVVTKVSR
jgi:hypothetical protein